MITQSEARLKGAQHMAHLGDWDYDIKADILTWSDENFTEYMALNLVQKYLSRGFNDEFCAS